MIAIIAAILFPVFAKAREKARQTACASNEKQIGLALMQYVQDNDETFPIVWSYGSIQYTDGKDWSDHISPYAGMKTEEGDGSASTSSAPMTPSRPSAILRKNGAPTR